MNADNALGALDDVGMAILEQLQEDGRRAFVTIGRAVGLSEASVRQRVHRLQESGILRIVAVTNSRMLGFHRHATVGIHVEGAAGSVATALAEILELDRVVITSGRFDILADLVCRNDEHVVEVIGHIRDTPGVRSTETFLHMKPVKKSSARV